MPTPKPSLQMPTPPASSLPASLRGTSKGRFSDLLRAGALLGVMAASAGAQPANNPPAKPATPPTPPASSPAPAAAPKEQPADPSKEESLRDASLQPVAEGQQGRPATPPSVAPSRPAPQPIAPTNAKGAPVLPAPIPGAIPGVPREDPGLSARRFYPEGTFLSKRAGKVLKATTGDIVFVPARDAKGRGEAPMIVLPSQTLARLEAAPGVFTPTSTVTLSGEVYVYYDRQYLLPSVYTVDRQNGDTTPTPTPTPTPAATPPTTPTPSTATPSAPPAAPGAAKSPEGVKSTEVADPAVADIIRELETKRGSAKAPDTVTGIRSEAVRGKDGAEPTETARTLAPAANGAVTTEGSVLFNRRARLVRVANGPLMVAFDGDTKSPAGPPMVLLRCRMVQRLDELAASRGDDLVLQVSGRVFVYGGRNYLLPTLAQVVPTGDVRSLQ